MEKGTKVFKIVSGRSSASKEDGHRVLVAAQEMQVIDITTRGIAGDMIAGINRKVNATDTARKELVGPLNAEVKNINTDFKESVVDYSKAKSVLNTKCVTWDAEQERIAKEKEDAARKEAEALEKKGEAEKATAVLDDIPQQRTTVHTAESTSYSVKRWDFDVINLKKVPPEYLEVKRGMVLNKLRALEKAGAKTEIPGIKAFKVRSTSSRS